MSSFTSPVLYTDRLILTWPTPDQVRGFYDAIIGTSMFDTILWDGPDSVEDMLEWWDVNRKRDPADPTVRLSLAVVEKNSGMYVGGAGLNPKAEEPSTVTISYTMAPMAQGRGYATETVQRLVDEAFTRRGVERIVGPVFVGNGSSRRVLEKAGFQLDGITPDALVKRGISIDMWNLSLEKERWEARALERQVAAQSGLQQ